MISLRPQGQSKCQEHSSPRHRYPVSRSCVQKRNVDNETEIIAATKNKSIDKRYCLPPCKCKGVGIKKKYKTTVYCCLFNGSLYARAAVGFRADSFLVLVLSSYICILLLLLQLVVGCWLPDGLRFFPADSSHFELNYILMKFIHNYTQQMVLLIEFASNRHIYILAYTYIRRTKDIRIFTVEV